MAEPVRHEAIASDGTPIGTVAASPTGDDMHLSFRPSTFDKHTGLINEVEKVLLADSVLDVTDTNSPDYVPTEVVDRLLPGYRDTAKHDKALEFYISGEFSLKGIADLLDLPERTVAKWAEVGNWIHFQEDLAKTLRRHERARLSILRSQRREEMMNEQIELGHKINEAAKEHIDNAETASQLKLAAEAAKLGSDMSNRALGIGDSGDVDNEGKAAAGDGKLSLVQVFNNSNGLPPIRISTPDAVEVGGQP